MKNQKIKKSNFYGETVFNIAVYYCYRNRSIGKRASKRALLSAVAIAQYLQKLPETKKEKINGI